MKTLNEFLSPADATRQAVAEATQDELDESFTDAAGKARLIMLQRQLETGYQKLLRSKNPDPQSLIIGDMLLNVSRMVLIAGSLSGELPAGLLAKLGVAKSYL